MIRVATRFPGLIPFMIASPLLVLARGFAARCAVRLCLTVRNPFRKDREATPRDNEAEPQTDKKRAFRKAGGFPHIWRQSREAVSANRRRFHAGNCRQAFADRRP